MPFRFFVDATVAIRRVAYFLLRKEVLREVKVRRRYERFLTPKRRRRKRRLYRDRYILNEIEYEIQMRNDSLQDFAKCLAA